MDKYIEKTPSVIHAIRVEAIKLDDLRHMAKILHRRVSIWWDKGIEGFKIQVGEYSPVSFIRGDWVVIKDEKLLKLKGNEFNALYNHLN